MAHTYTCLHCHANFSTKERRNLIPQDHVPRLHAYMAGIVRNIGGEGVVVGGTTNHAHLCMDLPPTIAVASAMDTIKANSSGWAKKELPGMSDFAWQEGYGAFAVSKSNVADVRQYVKDQARHHRAMTFEEEFRALLEKHGMAVDDRYIFG